jgi:hypothetical protein
LFLRSDKILEELEYLGDHGGPEGTMASEEDRGVLDQEREDHDCCTKATGFGNVQGSRRNGCGSKVRAEKFFEAEGGDT